MLKEENIDINKKEYYIVQVAEFEQKCKDKMSELRWADDEFEELVIKDELSKCTTRLKALNQRLTVISKMERGATAPL